jgi:hypothetical protein
MFTYTTATGGIAVIKIVGRGNLDGTSVEGGNLQLEFQGTNAFSKITGSVRGGNGRASLGSIFPSTSGNPGSKKRLSGIGGQVVQSVLLGSFDLIPGGVINLTAGVNSLVLNSVGDNTQINLRTLPATLQPSMQTSTTSTASSSSFGSSSSSASSGTAAPSNFTAGQTTTITNADNTTWTYLTDSTLGLTLSNVSGDFVQAGNITEPLAKGQPPSIPPAPPGIILKVNHISGNPAGPIDLLTDSDIFGYDPVLGQVVRFKLDLKTGTGAPDLDPSFNAIDVPGHPATAGLNLGWDGNQLDVLVSSGTMVYAYNATTGVLDGSFDAGMPVSSIAAADPTTVLGNAATGQLELINLPASLGAGVAKPISDKVAPFSVPAGFTLLGGLTGVPASNTVYATVAAHFNSFQPDEFQLGIESVNTVLVRRKPGDGTATSFGFSPVAQTAIKEQGAFVNVVPDPTVVTQPGPALGSVDHKLALGLGASGGTNTINLYEPSSLSPAGSIVLNYGDPVVALSANFRPNLTGSALVDIQGNVQSFRGGDARGLVLNDTGNLNLVKFVHMDSATIVGQPVGHIQIKDRSNVSILTPTRTVDGRNDVQVNHGLSQIGPLFQTGD